MNNSIISISRQSYDEFKKLKYKKQEKIFIELLAARVISNSAISIYTRKCIERNPKVYVASMFLKYAVAERNMPTIKKLLNCYRADPRIEDPISGISAITFALVKTKNENEEEKEEKFSEKCLEEFVKYVKRSNLTKVKQADCLILSELQLVHNYHNKKKLLDLLNKLYDFNLNTQYDHDLIIVKYNST